MLLPLSFSARVITGDGRGRTLGVPTLNLDLRDVPEELEIGVFACRAVIGGATFPATMHHGPRPTFGAIASCEVHLIDVSLPSPPEHVEVEVVEFLRGIATYPSAEALQVQMAEDIRRAKEIA